MSYVDLYHQACSRNATLTREMVKQRHVVDGLRVELVEAKNNIDRMAARYDEITAELKACQAERDRWKQDRVNIGIKLDLYRARVEPEVTQLRADNAELNATVEHMRIAVDVYCDGENTALAKLARAVDLLNYVRSLPDDDLFSGACWDKVDAFVADVAKGSPPTYQSCPTCGCPTEIHKPAPGVCRDSAPTGLEAGGKAECGEARVTYSPCYHGTPSSADCSNCVAEPPCTACGGFGAFDRRGMPVVLASLPAATLCGLCDGSGVAR